MSPLVVHLANATPTPPNRGRIRRYLAETVAGLALAALLYGALLTF